MDDENEEDDEETEESSLSCGFLNLMLGGGLVFGVTERIIDELGVESDLSCIETSYMNCIVWYGIIIGLVRAFCLAICL
jgi:hypothetical protein